VKSSSKIVLAFIALVFLSLYCLYSHTNSIYRQINKENTLTSATDTPKSEPVTIEINKTGEKIYFNATLDSQDAYEILDSKLIDATYSVTKSVNVDENLQDSTKVVALISKLIDILKERYKEGSIIYKEGLLTIEGKTDDPDAKALLDSLLSASLIPNIDNSVYEKKFVEMTYPELSVEAQALEVKMNEIAEIEDINFEEDSARLTPKSLETIQKIAEILKENSTYAIEISGHTDSVGDPEYNLELSKQRALSVKDALMKQGVDAKKMVANGYGDQRPLVDNNNEEDRKKNRRVEFKIIGE
jgi:OmpA-OmpF porin, OOP family